MGGSTSPITGSSSNCWLPALERAATARGPAPGVLQCGVPAACLRLCNGDAASQGNAKQLTSRIVLCSVQVTPGPRCTRLTLLKVEDGAQRRQLAALAHHADRGKASRQQRSAAGAYLRRGAGGHRLGVHRLPPPVLAVCRGGEREAGPGGATTQLTALPTHPPTHTGHHPNPTEYAGMQGERGSCRRASPAALFAQRRQLTRPRLHCSSRPPTRGRVRLHVLLAQDAVCSVGHHQRLLALARQHNMQRAGAQPRHACAGGQGKGDEAAVVLCMLLAGKSAARAAERGLNPRRAASQRLPVKPSVPCMPSCRRACLAHGETAQGAHPC